MTFCASYRNMKFAAISITKLKVIVVLKDLGWYLHALRSMYVEIKVSLTEIQRFSNEPHKEMKKLVDIANKI